MSIIQRHVVRVVLAAGLFASPTALASPEFGGELRMQMNAGGDTLASVTYSNGSKSDLKMGTYFTAAAGAAVTPLRAGPHALELKGLVGWSSWSTGPENTDDRLKLSRFPLELLAAYRYRLPVEGPWELRAGGGASYQLIGGVSGTGRLEGVSVDVHNALGWVGEAGVAWGILGLGVRYAKMRMQVGNATLDGSSIGVSLGLLFPPVATPEPAAAPGALTRT